MGSIGRDKLGKSSTLAQSERRSVVFALRELPTAILERHSLKPGVRFRGPAVVTEYSATTVVPPGASFHMDPAAHLVIELPPGHKTKGAS